MARNRSQSRDDRKRVVSVLLDAEEARLLDMTVNVLQVSPGEVMLRGLHLVGVTGQVLMGNGRVKVSTTSLALCE